MEKGGLRTKGIKKRSLVKNPLITIVTVVYNGKDSIEQTINSVINQEYKNIEYIIIDGNSNDGTLDIIKKYEHRIDYWQSEKDNGIYDAMNKAIKNASGDWINFMNSGDLFYSTDVISNIFIDDLSNYDVIYGNTLLYSSFGTKIYYPLQKFEKLSHMPFNHQSCFTKTSLYKEKGFDISFKICADFNFYKILINENKKFLYKNIIIARYETEEGLSVKNTFLLNKENFKIQNESNYKVKYFFFILVYNIKKVIKLFIPKKIILFRKKNKYYKDYK